MKNLASMLLLFLLITGCSRGSEYIQHTYLKNYNLNEVKTAYVGQPAVKVRDLYVDYDQYKAKTALRYYWKASDDFELTGKYIKKKYFGYNVKVVGKKGEMYATTGFTMVDGTSYTIVNLLNETTKTLTR